MDNLNRHGFGGGFKVPESYGKAIVARRKEKKKKEEEKEKEEKDALTKDEILAHLRLGGDDSLFSS